MPYQHNSVELEAAAKWLWRRYAINVDKEHEWVLTPGCIAERWRNDARGVLDAMGATR